MIRQDVVIALRRLQSSPGFTLAAVLTLALGIGANTTIFTAVNALLFRSLPVEHQDELVTLDFVGNADGIPIHSYPNYVDLRDRNDVLAGLVAYRPYPIGFRVGAGATSRILGLEVSGNYFDVLGVTALHGRMLHDADNLKKGAHPVAVVGHSFWRRRLGADPNAVGSTMKLNGMDYTIAGVAPPEFFGTEVVINPDVYVPMVMQAQLEPGDDWLEERRSRNIWVLGRVKPGVSLARAEAGLNSVLTQLGREFPAANAGWRISLSRPGLVGSLGRGPVLGFSVVLMAVAGTVLLLACVNLANLLLARASDRRREMAVRLALGAGRRHLIRQLLTESVLLSLAGGATALLLTGWLAGLFAAWRAAMDLPILDLTVDIRVIAFAAATSIATGIMSGLGPALQSTRRDLAPALKGGAIVETLQRWHMRDALVVTQVALSAVLLAGSVLVVRSLQNALSVNLGFEPKHAVSVSFDLSLQGYDGAHARDFERRLIDKVRALPGIESAGLINGLPLSFAISNCYIFVEGKPVLRDVEAPMAARYWSGPGYLRAAQTKLISGRDFDEHDELQQAPAVLVNETFARQLFPGESPLGRRFRYCDSSSEPREIVGVVEDGKYHSLGEPPTPAVFSPLGQFTGPMGTVVARSSLPEKNVVEMLRRAVTELDSAVTALDAGSLTEHLGLALLPAGVAAIALGAFGVLAMVLAATGIYGVTAYAVSRRTREIGIRVALGASTSQVLHTVLRRTVTLITIGTVAGLGLALATGRFLAPLLYGVRAGDPLTYLVTVLLIAVVAALACLVPSRRALGVDPLEGLRTE